MAVATKKRARIGISGVRAAIESLRVENGDLLLVRCPVALASAKRSLLAIIDKWLTGRRIDVAVVEVPDGIDMAVVSGDLLRSSGWVHTGEMKELVAEKKSDDLVRLEYRAQRVRDAYRQCEEEAQHGEADLEPLRKAVRLLVIETDRMYPVEPAE